MKHQVIEDRLNDYTDGLLAAAEQQEVERHLERCAGCRDEVRAMRSLVSDLSGLPGRQPGRDLWPEISDRLGRKRVVSVDFGGTGGHSVWFRRGLLAAAAVVLMALSSALTAFWMSGRDAGVVSEYPGHPVLEAKAEFRTFETTYSLVIDELSGELQKRRHTLAPETVAVIETNLKIIDEAIRTSRAALAADPGNQDLIHTVSAMYEEKVALLQRATRLPREI